MDIVHKGERKRKQKKTLGNIDVMDRNSYDGMELDAKATLIQELIPLGLMAIGEELKKEVEQLAGPRYSRKNTEKASRYGSNPGTVRLAEQLMPIRVPRLRREGQEIPLESYQRFHRGSEMNEGLFRRVLYGISCRDYEAASEAIPGAIGVSASTVSRKFVEASAEKLKEFQTRDLSSLDVIALFVDGKTFADDSMIIVVAVTMEGKKIPIGFLQAETENHVAISDFFNGLIKRGLDVEQGVLFVVDGSKGIKKAINLVFRKRSLLQRCQWHKRENVVSYLPKIRRAYWRKRLQRAYQLSDYKKAKDALYKIMDELEDENQSAAASLKEGLEETLTLHRLGVFHLVGLSLKTTNCIESINSMAEQRCGKIDYWKNSNQKHRWLASALLDIEPRLKTLMGVRHLEKLRLAIMRELKISIHATKDRAA